MKNSSFKFATLALALVALTGCQKEQSSFDIEDVPGEAKIMGTLAYDAGQGYQNGTYTQIIKAAANVRVVAVVDNSTIHATATGKTVYETKTDANGNYTITVPAHYNGEVSVKVSADPFFDNYSKVIDVENGAPQFETKNVVFKLEPKTVSVTPNDVEIGDGTFTPEGRNILEAYKYNSTFIVKVGEGIVSKKKAAKEEGKESDEVVYEIVKEYQGVNGKNVLVEINGVKYAAATKSNGEATFIIPSEQKAWVAENVNITVPGYVVSEYEFYNEELNEENGEMEIKRHYIENGTFEQYADDKQFSIVFKGIAGAPAPVSKVRMIFKPFEGVKDYDYYWGDADEYSWVKE